MATQPKLTTGVVPEGVHLKSTLLLYNHSAILKESYNAGVKSAWFDAASAIAAGQGSGLPWSQPIRFL